MGTRRKYKGKIRANSLNPPLVKGEDKKVKIILPFIKGELEPALVRVGKHYIAT